MHARWSLLTMAIFAVLTVASTGAMAQPGPTPASPPPVPYGNGGYGYPPQPNYSLLTPDERNLLVRGEISSGEILAGGMLAFWVGFGAGHAVQGRFGSTGWKFTVGEVAAIVVAFAGLAQFAEEADDPYAEPDTDGLNLMFGGMIGYAVLRTWEFIDVLVAPATHNQKVRAARFKAYGAAPPRYSLFVAPTQRGGGIAGLSLRF